MTALLLTIHFVVAVAMVGTILLQRSEGGALGLGGGGGVGGLMSGRGAANALSRTTVILGAIFLSTSLALALIAKSNSHGTSVLAPTSGRPTTPSPMPALPQPLGPTPSSPSTAPAPSVPAVPVPSQPAPSQPAPAAPAPAPSPAPAGGGQ